MLSVDILSKHHISLTLNTAAYHSKPLTDLADKTAVIVFMWPYGHS